MAQRIPAGSVGRTLESGTIARIFTGAPIPQGADAVVMQEDCIVLEQSDMVQINSVPNPGQWIRRRGGYDGVIEVGMTLCVESYAGEVGGPDGVKLEEMVLITETGVEFLGLTPYEESWL